MHVHRTKPYKSKIYRIIIKNINIWWLFSVEFLMALILRDHDIIIHPYLKRRNADVTKQNHS